MINYRNPELIERYEDAVFELDRVLNNPDNGDHQIKTGHRFVVDNTGETVPLDWYNVDSM